MKDGGFLLGYIVSSIVVLIIVLLLKGRSK